MDGEVTLPPGPALSYLPEVVVGQFLLIARRIICTKFVPRIWFRIAKRRRERLTLRRPVFHDRLSSERVCEAALIQASEFVVSAGASDVAYVLSRKAVPCAFAAGEIVSHHGEPSGSGVVVVLQGRVDLFELVCRRTTSTAYFGYHSGPAKEISRQAQTPSKVHHEDVSYGALQEDAQMIPDQRVDFRGVHHPPHLRFSSIKGKGLTNAVFLRSVEAPFVIGDLAVLNDEPRLFYVVAATNIDTMTISKQMVVNLMRAIPSPSISLKLLSVAHAVRAANMTKSFPLTVARLQLSPLLGYLSPETLELLLVAAKPRVFARDTVLLERQKLCHHVYVIRRGVVEERRERGGGIVRQTAVHLMEGATFGERDAYFKERTDATYRAVTNVDAYLIPMEDVLRLCSRSETVRVRVAEAAKLLKSLDLHEDSLASASTAAVDCSENSNLGSGAAVVNPAAPSSPSSRLNRIVACMKRIPLWGVVEMPVELILSLKSLWSFTQFSKGDYLFRKSEVCCNLVVVLRGHAVLVDGPPQGSTLTIGECVGYTCLVQHRWLYSAISTESTDVATLPVQRFYDAVAKYDREGRSSLLEGSLRFLDTVDEPESGRTPAQSGGVVPPTPPKHQQTRILARLQQATCQLVQPLSRRQHRFPVLDEVCKRVPSPNTFPQLTIANLHPTVLDDRAPMIQLYAPPNSAPRRCKSSSEKHHERRVWSAKVALTEAFRAAVMECKVLHRKATAIMVAPEAMMATTAREVGLARSAGAVGTSRDLLRAGASPSSVTISAAAAVAEGVTGSVLGDSDCREVGKMANIAAAAETRTARLVAPAVDDLGNPLTVASTSWKNEGEPAKRSHRSTAVPQVAVEPSRHEDGSASLLSASQGSLATDPRIVDDAASRRLGPTDRETPEGGLAALPSSNRSPIQRLSDISSGRSAQVEERLLAILRPVTPRDRDSPSRQRRSDSGSERCPDALPKALEAVALVVEKPPSGPQGLASEHAKGSPRCRKPAGVAHITPRARNSGITFSASERYGSLMQAMRSVSTSRRASGLTSAADGPTGDHLPVGVEDQSKAAYMWNSACVAAPLIASRATSVTLRRRVAEAMREDANCRETPRRDRCTATRPGKAFGYISK